MKYQRPTNFIEFFYGWLHLYLVATLMYGIGMFFYTVWEEGILLQGIASVVGFIGVPWVIWKLWK